MSHATQTAPLSAAAFCAGPKWNHIIMHLFIREGRDKVELHPWSSGRRGWTRAALSPVTAFGYSAPPPLQKLPCRGSLTCGVIWFHVRCLACVVDCHTQLLLIRGGVFTEFPSPPSLFFFSASHVTQRWPFTPPLDLGLHHIKWQGNKWVA